MNSLKLGLCGPGRHEIPGVGDYIFPAEINPLDVSALEAQAAIALDGAHAVDLYVTGLSVALVAVINVAYRNGVALKLWHYDRESATYYPQSVDMRARCDLAQNGLRHTGCYGL